VEKGKVKLVRKKPRRAPGEFYGLGFGFIGMGLILFACLAAFNMHPALQDYFVILMFVLIGAGLLFLLLGRLTSG
jgi:hypothetical protein